jgi:hypothetical protein
MAKIMTCRRTFICTLSVICLTAIALVKGMDVSTSIAAIAIGIAGANAAEGSVAKIKAAVK